MALTKVIDAVTAAVLEPAATVFTTTGTCVVDAVGLEVDENILVYKLMSDALYHPATNKDGAIVLSWAPNNVVLEALGSYKLVKPTVTGEVTAGYEEI